MNLILHPEDRASSLNRTQGRLLSMAALFLMFCASALTLSPAVRLRSLATPLRWDHWLTLPAWLLAFGLAHRYTSRRLPHRDPALLPIAGVLMGWGTLTIWRVAPEFGLRQTIWILLASALLLLGLRLPSHLKPLRDYKYLWLSGGLALTALTLVLGTNPAGVGPRLWLGCCGIYIQPSEPLKLLLVVYLAAYLADRQRQIPRLLPMLAPTLIMIGLSLALLLVQRDLGTATLFLMLYTSVTYIATGRRRILLASLAAIVAAGLLGYQLFDVVRIRIEAWLNPWQDPSGRSFQIVQSLLAVAAGGMLGRGPGMGSPNLVPVQHSDFIFASIAEEGGLVSALGLILLIALFTARGLRAALEAVDDYRRYLGVGLAAFLALQSVLIMGGNLRLLPLTGVTLPFVSYGGSSLVTSTLALLVLLHISNRPETTPAPLPNRAPYLQVGGLLLAGLLATALVSGWWAFVRGPDLLTRTDNARRVIADRFVRRGALMDRAETPLNATTGQTGELLRQYLYTPLSPVLGYNDPVYGQAGLEESLDGYLRGLLEQPALDIWWDHILYSQTPPGLDIRLSLDLALQRPADQLLEGHTGALVLIKAGSGEILAMASHPYFDPGLLESTWDQFIDDPGAPLLNRAMQGSYPAGSALGPILLPDLLARGALPTFEVQANSGSLGRSLDCAVRLEEPGWSSALQAGCFESILQLGRSAGSEPARAALLASGLYEVPELRLAAAAPTALDLSTNQVSLDELLTSLRVSPMQMALAVAPLSASGQRPAPRLAMAVKTPDRGWAVLPALSANQQVLSPQTADQAAAFLAAEDVPVWEAISHTTAGSRESISWYTGGTTPDWEGSPLTLVIVLEGSSPEIAREMARAIWREALQGAG